jgi:hypothetical protein
MPPLLSIIIPTKNRYKYLIKILEIFSTYQWCSEKVEIVIQDNSINNSLILDFLKNNNKISNLVSYYHNYDILSQSENSNLATKNAKGEYLCFIGDDDCVNENIIQATIWMKFNNYDILNNTKPEFIWNDVSPKRLNKNFSGFLLSFKYDASFKIYNSNTQLKLHLKSGGQYIKNLPQFYHGIVKKSILDKINDNCGTYFPGPSPDMAVAIALTKFASNFTILNYPLIISGKGSGSVGGMGLKGKHIGDISSISFLPKNTANDWSNFIPFYWSGSTIFAESVLKALIKTNREILIKDFNYNYFYARCLHFDFTYLKEILITIQKNYKSSLFKILIYFIKIFFKRFKIYLINRSMFKLFTNKKYHFNVNNMNEVINILNLETDNLKLPWDFKN